MQVIVGALAASGLHPTRLEIEITETVLLQNREATLAVLHQLRALGVRIAMDDFGTGYSSLTYLQCFPFDKIKIDRSFVKDITENAGSLNIVRAVAALANGMGMTATAEGVETREQLDSITSEGCTEMQGFLFSKPLPAPEIERLFHLGGVRRRRKVSRPVTLRRGGHGALQLDRISSTRLRRRGNVTSNVEIKTLWRSWPASRAARRGWRGPAVR